MVVEILLGFVTLLFGTSCYVIWNTTKKLENAIFLGVAKDDVSTREIYEYCLKYTTIKNPCMVAIGDQTFYVDESHFFFYNRRNNEKIDRSYAK